MGVGPSNGVGELTLEGYFQQTSESDRFKLTRDRERYYTLGLVGEVGGLLAKFKKNKRDQLNSQERNFAKEEIGDSLWYLLRAADSEGIKASAIGHASILWLVQRHHAVKETKSVAPSFAELDRLTKTVRRSPTERLLLVQLAQQCGAVAQSNVVASERYAAVMSILALLAHRWKLTFDDVARHNILKIRDRWPGKRPRYVPLFDEEYEPHEQLPRRFTVEFVERKRAGTPHVVQSINGIAIGDPLTDNNDEDDGYRYHDVFHLAYAVHLGWSPVIRALLKVKRKSNTKVDTTQDGARAIIIEEGIATWIFNYDSHNWFAKIEEGDLDFSLLKQVRKIVRSYEVQDCPLWQWERAILGGMRVFKQLYENQGGSVTVDLNRRKLTYALPRRMAKV